MTEPRPQYYEIHISDFRSSMACDLCDRSILKGEQYVIEIPSYYRLCRQCIKTLFVFLQDNKNKLMTL